MKPELVNPNNFEVEEIVFDNGDFSIAYGSYKKGDRTLAMRWNGDEPTDAGYPKVFGHPMWFIVDHELMIPFLKALLGESVNSNDTKITVILKEEVETFYRKKLEAYEERDRAKKKIVGIAEE